MALRWVEFALARPPGASLAARPDALEQIQPAPDVQEIFDSLAESRPILSGWAQLPVNRVHSPLQDAGPQAQLFSEVQPRERLPAAQ